jgi:hypothetical protein
MNKIILKKNIKKILLEEANKEKIDFLINSIVDLNQKVLELSSVINIQTTNKEKIRIGFGLCISKTGRSILISFCILFLREDNSIFRILMLISKSKHHSLTGNIPSKYGEKIFNHINFYFDDIIIEKSDETINNLNNIINIIPKGSITIHNLIDGCFGSFTVSNTHHTTTGWGPLLYEIAIEIASDIGGGLISDRYSVSDSAYNIWSNYLKNRPDIEKLQLDIDLDLTDVNDIDDIKQLTPTFKDDDCELNSTVDHIGKSFLRKNADAWVESPLSKVYKKDSKVVINKLTKLGLIYKTI